MVATRDVQTTHRQPHEPDDYIKKSYRYIRLSLVAMVALILLAVAIQSWPVWTLEFQSSLSAYYYTAARPIFVACLVAIGVCLVALKGSSDKEDVVLNLAGLMAPVVALVPTPRFDEIDVCPGSTAQNDTCQLVRDRIHDDISNNFLALLVLGWVIVGLLVIAQFRKGWKDGPRAGVIISVVVLLGYTFWFKWDRDSFGDLAHYISASLLFVFIWIVVLFNARRQWLTDAKRIVDAKNLPSDENLRRIAVEQRTMAIARAKAMVSGGTLAQRARRGFRRFWQLMFWRPNRYGVVALVMMLVALILGGLAVFNSLTPSAPLESVRIIFWLEILLIIPFGVFWVIQTFEFRDKLPVQEIDPEHWAAGLP